MLLTGHKTRAVSGRYNIVSEQELLTAGQRLAAYLADGKPKNVRGAASPASEVRCSAKACGSPTKTGSCDPRFATGIPKASYVRRLLARLFLLTHRR